MQSLVKFSTIIEFELHCLVGLCEAIKSYHCIAEQVGRETLVVSRCWCR